MKYNFLNSTILFLIINACTVTRPLTSNVAPSEITDLKLMEPYSYISMIRKGNRGQIDDSISFISKHLVYKILDVYKGQMPLSGSIVLSDTGINRSLEKEYDYLIQTAEKTRNISNLRITPTLDKVLEANQTRFGLIIICTGFTRIKGNYGKQIAKGAALGILTLGMYYQVPVKAYSKIHVMIVDSKEDNIAFFRTSFLQDMEPLDQNVLIKQYKKIFEGYFWNSKQR